MNMLRSLCLALLMAVSLQQAAFADVTSERASVRFVSDSASVQAGKPFWVLLHVHLQPGWHTYWRNPGDSGTVPGLHFTLPKGFSASEVQYQAPDRLATPPLVDYGYHDDAYYLVKITPPASIWNNATIIVMLKAQWLVCKDICVPENGEFSLAMPVSAAPQPSVDAPLIATLAARLPEPIAASLPYQVQGADISFEAPLTKAALEGLKDAQFFPVTEPFIVNAAAQTYRVTERGLRFTQRKAGAPPNASGVVSLFTAGGRKDYNIALVKDAMATPAAPAALAPHAPSAAATTPAPPKTPLEALPIGGVTNITLFAALWFAFLGGIVLNLMPCVFPILSLKALALARKADAAPRRIREQGLSYTLGVVVSFVGLALVLIAVQQGGKAAGWGYQMQSPVFVAALAVLMFTVGLNLSGYFELPVLMGGVGQGRARDSVSGSFFTGVLAVLVATPCTAPFMASALGFALTQPVPVVILVFTALGLGLAAPFLWLSFFPAWVRLLPRPGVWMLRLREFLAFPLYLSSIWLVWVLMREAGADAAAMALGLMTLIAFALWLGARDMPLARICALSLACAGCAASLTGIDMLYKRANLPQMGSEPFSFARLAALRDDNRTVFVDATADWCITCKVNESVALAPHQVREAFLRRHVAYMVADWTQANAEITRYLRDFGRSGVPLYVVYPPHHAAPVVLPQILTPSLVLKAIEP